MGCCINYFIGFKDVEVLDNVLSMVASMAIEEGFKVAKFERSERRKTLFISPHKDCDPLKFDFRRITDWAKSGDDLFRGKEVKEIDWDGEGGMPAGRACTFLTPDLWYSADFTKTEYAPKSVHAKTCELLRLMAPFASLFCIRDEAGFYETRSKERLLEYHGYVAGSRVNDLG